MPGSGSWTGSGSVGSAAAGRAGGPAWRGGAGRGGARAGRCRGPGRGRRDGRGGVVAAQDAVGVPDDAGGGGGDAVPGGQDGCGGLGAGVAAGPAFGVGELPGGGDAVAGAGDVGDGVGFGLAQPGAAGGGRPGRVAAGLVVQQDVAELVRQRPDSLLRAQGRQDPDAARGPEDGAVGRGAVLLLDGESLAAREPAQRVPQARRGGAGRWQAGRDRGRRPGGLRHVPDVGGPGGIAPGRQRLVVTGFTVVLRSPGGGAGRDGEGLDALFAAADLPPGLGPLRVVADHDGAGYLGGDEQGVREVLFRHQRRRAQQRGPVAGGAQRLGAGVQAGTERGQLLLRLVFPCRPGGGGMRRGHRCSPGRPSGPGSCPGSRSRAARAVPLPLTGCSAAGSPGAPSGPGGALVPAWPEAAASSAPRLSLATRWPAWRSMAPSAFWLRRSPRRRAPARMSAAAATISPSRPASGPPSSCPPPSGSASRSGAGPGSGPPGAAGAGGRFPGAAPGAAAGRGGRRRGGGDQAGDDVAGRAGGGVVEQGQVRGLGEHLDVAEHVGGDGLVAAEAGADEGGVRAALGHAHAAGRQGAGPGRPVAGGQRAAQLVQAPGGLLGPHPAGRGLRRQVLVGGERPLHPEPLDGVQPAHRPDPPVGAARLALAQFAQGELEQDGGDDGHHRERLGGAGPVRRVAGVEGGGGRDQPPDGQAGAEPRLVPRGAARQQHGADAGRAVQGEEQQVRPGAGQAHVRAGEPGQALGGDPGGDRGEPAEQQVLEGRRRYLPRRRPPAHRRPARLAGRPVPAACGRCTAITPPWKIKIDFNHHLTLFITFTQSLEPVYVTLKGSHQPCCGR